MGGGLGKPKPGVTADNAAAGCGADSSRETALAQKLRQLEREHAAQAQELSELKARFTPGTSHTSGADVSAISSRSRDEKPDAAREVDPEVEMFIRSLEPEREIASQLFAGAALADLLDMTPAQIATALQKAMPAIQRRFEAAQRKARLAQEAHAAGGGKFQGVLQGGSLQDFLGGISGLTGEPDADMENGVDEEHTAKPDACIKFSTGNYGVRVNCDLQTRDYSL